MDEGEKTQNQERGVRGLLNDETKRTFLSSTISLVVTLAFAGYHVFLSVAYGAVWNIGIAVYYALLGGIRAFILFAEVILHRLGTTDERKERVRGRLFFVQSVVLFIIDVALVTPIVLMMLQEMDVNYTEIPAIASAVYTFYKIVLATINYVKNRERQHLSVQILKNLNFVDALVSVLSLQYILIVTFGNGIEGDMKIMCAFSSFAIWALIVAVSLLALLKAIKLKRN